MHFIKDQATIQIRRPLLRAYFQIQVTNIAYL